MWDNIKMTVIAWYYILMIMVVMPIVWAICILGPIVLMIAGFVLLGKLIGG